MNKSLTVLGPVLTATVLTTLTALATAPPVLAGSASSAGQVAGHVGQATRARAPSTANGQIAFRRYFDADQTQGAVFVMNPDGSDLHQVTHPPRGWKDNVPTWSPDGGSIVFERFASDESTSRIMLVDPDTGDTRTVVPCALPRCAYAIDPYFAPDGRSVAYARTVAPGTAHPAEWQLYTAIFVVGLDGRGSRQLTSTPPRSPGTQAVEATDPTFSPDGELLAYIRTRHGPTDSSAVFVQPTGSTSGARRITPWKMSCQDRPTFSPDGKLLLFRCTPKGEEGPSNLYLVHPDGTGLHLLTVPSVGRQYLGSGFSPTFRHGQGWITAGRTGGSGADGNADVYRILIRDGHAVRTVNLTRSEEWDSAAQWGTHPASG